MLPAPTDPDEAMLRRLAEMDMAAAEKAHSALMEAETAVEIGAAMRTYQRAARSVRQTLMLKGRLKQMAAPRAPAATSPPITPWVDPDPGGKRNEALHDAVARVIAAAYPDDEDRRDELHDAHDDNIDADAERPDFLCAPFNAQVADYCRRLGLPEELIARWSHLPEGRPFLYFGRAERAFGPLPEREASG